MQVFDQTRCLGEVHSVVVYAEDLMHHSLVRPLVEQGGDGVVTTIEQQKDRSNVGVEGEESLFPSHD